LKTVRNRILFGELTAIAIIALAFVSCTANGSGSQDAKATGTAQARVEAIARFTAEAALTPEPTSTPEPTPTEAAEIPAPSMTIAPDVSNEADRDAIEQLLIERASAFSTGDLDRWYATCEESIREAGRSGKSLDRQYLAIGFEPDPQAQVEFLVEQILFSGDDLATVLWGVRVGTDHFPSFGGGPYVKVDGEWFSQGWGCVG